MTSSLSHLCFRIKSGFKGFLSPESAMQEATPSSHKPAAPLGGIINNRFARLAYNPPQPWDELQLYSGEHGLRESLKTGDLIVFFSNEPLSWFLKMLSPDGIWYSHIGMVLRQEVLPGAGDTLFLVESNVYTGQPDIITGQMIEGIQIHLLSERLRQFRGNAWCAPLKNASDTHRENIRQFLGDRKKHPGSKTFDRGGAWSTFFEKGLVHTNNELGNEAKESLGHKFLKAKSYFQNSPESFFCSELVAAALQYAGLIDKKKKIGNLTPYDIMIEPELIKPKRKIKNDLGDLENMDTASIKSARTS